MKLLKDVTLVSIVRIGIIVLGALSLVMTIKLHIHRILTHKSSTERTYSYVGDDFPTSFEIPNFDTRVRHVSERTVHYQLNGTLADVEWKLLLPEPAVLVRLGPGFRPFAISMLHSLHCLDKLRRGLHEIPRTKVGIMHVEHCANYLRESIMCAADTSLMNRDEALQTETRECRDWIAVYEEIQRNHDRFVSASLEASQI